jgi:hypothetical protein
MKAAAAGKFKNLTRDFPAEPSNLCAILSSSAE